MTVTSRLAIHVSQPPRAFGTLQWVLDTQCPPDWVAQLVRFGGGFFHSPVGLAVSQPDGVPLFARLLLGGEVAGIDRKSTRLNSSHQIISYAVFCLKKKTDAPATPVRPACRPPCR